MKKFTLMAVALVAISLASCKKDHACKCTYTDSDGDVQVYDITYTETKKGNAKDACSNSATSRTRNGDTNSSKTECELK